MSRGIPSLAYSGSPTESVDDEAGDADEPAVMSLSLLLPRSPTLPLPLSGDGAVAAEDAAAAAANVDWSIFIFFMKMCRSSACMRSSMFELMMSHCARACACVFEEKRVLTLRFKQTFYLLLKCQAAKWQ